MSGDSGTNSSYWDALSGLAAQLEKMGKKVQKAGGFFSFQPTHHMGSFTRANGTTGTAGNLLFNQVNFHTKFVNHIAVSSAAKQLTNWKGAGFIRDLQEAATIDAGLAGKPKWISLVRIDACEAANDVVYRLLD